MALGPGKYDDLCTFVRLQTEAEAALVIVIDGRLGSGFACQAPLATQLRLADVLEDVAKQIRESGPFAAAPTKGDA